VTKKRALPSWMEGEQWSSLTTERKSGSKGRNDILTKTKQRRNSKEKKEDLHLKRETGKCIEGSFLKMHQTAGAGTTSKALRKREGKRVWGVQARQIIQPSSGGLG